MALKDAYAAYNTSKVQTASPAELTLMLYDGAIKFCNIAISAAEAGDVEQTHYNIMKVEAIIEEFRATLNHKYEVAKDFEVIYDYIYSRLVEANITKDVEVLNVVLVQLRGMRDTWKQVMKLAKTSAS